MFHNIKGIQIGQLFWLKPIHTWLYYQNLPLRYEIRHQIQRKKPNSILEWKDIYKEMIFTKSRTLLWLLQSTKCYIKLKYLFLITPLAILHIYIITMSSALAIPHTYFYINIGKARNFNQKYEFRRIFIYLLTI